METNDIKKKYTIITLHNQGFCYGVKRSLQLSYDYINNNLNRKIFFLGSLVHNENINNHLIKNNNILILKDNSRKAMIKQIDDLHDLTIISSAHGIGDNIYKLINNNVINKNWTLLDATCPYVKKSYQLIKNKLDEGYVVFFIGKKTHPEVEAVLSFSNDVYLIEENTTEFPVINKRIVIACQTTMTKHDLSKIIPRIEEVYPNVEIIESVCHETEKRQMELNSLLVNESINNNLDKVLVIIVGDKLSHNANKLFELANSFSVKVLFLLYPNDELYSLLASNKYNKLIIASSTSTPDELITNLIKVL